MVHLGTVTGVRKKIALSLSVKTALLSVSINMVYISTLRSVVSAAAFEVWMREMNCAARRV